MNQIQLRYLMVYLEPTSYIIAFIKEVLKQVEGRVDVLFISKNISQEWNLSLDGIPGRILPGGLLSSTRILYRSIARGRYRVVHLAGWGNIFLLIALFVAKLHRIPVVVESDTPLYVCLPAWKRCIKAVLYPVLFSIPTMLLPAGSRQVEYFRHYRVDEKRIRIVNMTVDVTHIIKRCIELGESGRNNVRTKLGFCVEDVVFIFVGRIVDWKGIKDLVASFELISCKHSNVKLLVVGDGPSREFVCKAAENNRAIKYAGRLDQEGVIEMYHAADVAILPGHFESWGLVVNEAMAAGLPVIATGAVGCVDDLVKKDFTGIVVEVGDIKAIAGAMEAMLENPLKRKRMAKMAGDFISGWTLEEEVRKIIQVWNEVRR